MIIFPQVNINGENVGWTESYDGMYHEEGRNIFLMKNPTKGAVTDVNLWSRQTNI